LRPQWPRARCAPQAARSAGNSFAESSEEFSAAADAEDSCDDARRGDHRSCGQALERNKIAGHVLHTRRFELFFVYGVGAPAGLVGSFFFPLPAFTSTSVAVIV